MVRGNMLNFANKLSYAFDNGQDCAETLLCTIYQFMIMRPWNVKSKK